MSLVDALSSSTAIIVIFTLTFYANVSLLHWFTAVIVIVVDCIQGDHPSGKRGNQRATVYRSGAR